MARKKDAASPTPTGEDLPARARRVSSALRKAYKGQGTALHFQTPFQLLIATILSAQSTDVRINQITPELFKRFPDARALAAADPAEVEAIIRTSGFFRQKAKAIIGASQAIVERHAGRMPESMEELVELPGVGRKTAHVVRGNALGLPAIFVDTHVKRVAGRLAITLHADPDKIEKDIAGLLPEREWTDFCSALIWHGRRVCVARNPKCAECVVNHDCPTGRQRLGLD